MLGRIAVDAPIEANIKLLPHQEILDDPGKYQRLPSKLNYVIVLRPDIVFVVSIVGQFLSISKTTYWDAVVQILRYLKKTPGKVFYIQIVISHILNGQDHPLTCA